jgi:hypothetical protein
LEVPFDLGALAAAVEHSPLAAAIRSSPGLYPAVNLAHLAGLVLLVGGIGVLDLRIAGLARAIPVQALSRLCTPVAIVGLLLMLASGALMFSADAVPLIGSRVFQLKMTLLAVALANALLFRRLYGGLAREPGPLARIMAVASIGLWLTVAALGRLIGYT